MAASSRTMDFGGVNWIARGFYTSPAPGQTQRQIVDSDGIVYPKINVVNVTADATRTITAAESGTLFLMNKATGIVFTLPDASDDTIGLYYDFLVNTSVTSNAYKWSTNTQGTEFFNGGVQTVDTDTAASPVNHAGDGSTHDNISMNGTTTGGLVGTKLRITCVSATLWTVNGLNFASGTVATPFATS